uniref:Ribosomal protein S7 n=1 Tax=Callipsygma wilsonis TaxID=2320807 RepID=A0A386AZZ4_9CHLO|nr:ribosomal protein S7 [Callipsygma wilsonis]AYC65014.1 ribosomal protein S7 [Callipsygma wilsonis]
MKNKKYMIYDIYLIKKINQKLIKNGKKKLAYRIFIKSLNFIKTKKKKNPLIILKKAIKNTTSSIKIQTRRIRKSTYFIPIEISKDRAISQAIRWIITSAKKKSSRNTFYQNLANEFINASKKTGNAFYRKQETKKIAAANTRKNRRKNKNNKKSRKNKNNKKT